MVLLPFPGLVFFLPLAWACYRVRGSGTEPAMILPLLVFAGAALQGLTDGSSLLQQEEGREHACRAYLGILRRRRRGEGPSLTM